MARKIHDRGDELLDHHRDQVTADQRQPHAPSQAKEFPGARHLLGRRALTPPARGIMIAKDFHSAKAFRQIRGKSFVIMT
jgi:hypothetical protein